MNFGGEFLEGESVRGLKQKMEDLKLGAKNPIPELGAQKFASQKFASQISTPRSGSRGAKSLCCETYL